MFTYVKAKNFKSLKNIEFNLNKTKMETNKFISIYGENGSGKTNIVELFKFLQKSVLARAFDIAMNKVPQNLIKMPKEIENNVPVELLEIINFSMDINEYRMIDEKEDTEIEYGFKINDKNGFYYIKFNSEIVEEKLYYMADKQRAYLFELNKENNKIIKKLNKKIFLNDRYNDDLIDEINKYWGRYSFLSLLSFEMLEKNHEYISNNISQNITKVISKIWDMTVIVDKGISKIMNANQERTKKLNNIQNGTIEREQLDKLNKYQNVLNIFFTQAYADIKNVRYITTESEDKIVFAFKALK